MSALPTALLTLLLVTLAACGQSGPLHLPDTPSDVQQAPQENSQAPVNTAEDEEEDAAH